MVKILHVISDKNIGGAGKLLLNTICEHDRSKFGLSVALPNGSLLTPHVKNAGIRAKESNLSLLELIKIIHTEKPDIVHTHACTKARIAARLCLVPITVNTKHCATDTKEKLGFCKRLAVFLFDFLFTSHTIATAEYVKERLALDGIPQKKITVIINGSLPLKTYTDEEKALLRVKYGFDVNDFLVGIVARVERGKGQEYFAEAAEICKKIAPRIKFIVVGEGAMLENLKSSASNLNNLFFTGFLSDVSEIMNILDANVNCSYISETSSLSLSEGMSVGAIPVVSNCGGNAFMAKKCGIVVPQKDGRALADALIKLAESPHTAKELKKAAILRFFDEFTAKAMVRKTEKLYLSLLGKL
ncbi:MAG: glycosyltransferase [Clostridia bacterium]|nr:glycosyltransferase [Clostridia bacterium]